MKIQYNEEREPHYYYYDNAGNLIKETVQPDKNSSAAVYTTNYTYNNIGKLLSKTDANNNITRNVYDDLGRLIQVVNALGETTYYEYNNMGNLTKITTAGGSITKKDYDELGRLIKETDPLGKIEYSEYDGAGNIVSQVDRKGQVSTFTYDELNRVISSVKGTINTGYTYDNAGNTLTATDNNGTIKYEYYENGSVKKETLPDNKSIYYEYDNQGNRIRMIDQYGKETSYSFDSRNRLKTVNVDSQTTTYDYFPDGSRKTITYHGGIVEEYSYDGCNNLLSLVNKKADSTIINQFSYTYDPVGNQLTKKDKNGTTTYTYDKINRVSTIKDNSGKTITYTYDKNGNISAENTSDNLGQAQSKGYTYDSANRLKQIDNMNSSGQTVASTLLEYDDNGNMLKRTEQTGTIITETTNYKYDVLNRLSEYTDSKGLTNYSYYPGGLRKSKTSGGSTTAYYYDGENVIIETVNGNYSARNIWGINPIARQNAQNTTLYYLYNGHADVMAMVDGTGNVINSYDYDIYGSIKESTETGMQNPIKYAGQYYDDESKSYYLRARYYDPGLMRFITEDTNKGDVGDPLSLNLYTYCQGNPIMYYDSTGNGPEIVLLYFVPVIGQATLGVTVVAGVAYAGWEFGSWLNNIVYSKSNEPPKIKLPDYRGKNFNKKEISKNNKNWKQEKTPDPQRWLKRLIETGYVIQEWTKGVDGDSLIQRVISRPDGTPRYVLHMLQPGGNGQYFPLHYHIFDAFGNIVEEMHYYWDKVYYFIE